MIFTVSYFLLIALSLIVLQVGFKKSRLHGIVITSISILLYFNPIAAGVTLLTSVLTYFALKSKNRNIQIGLIVILIVVFLLSKSIASSTSFLVGYSYYFLQLLSLLIYPPKKEVKLIDVIAGTTFFTRFFAGPILTKNQLNVTGKIKKEDIIYGLNRISLGIFKKVVLSNRLVDMQSGYFDYPLEAQNGLLVLVSSLLFTAQMYLDFSAYSDIAIGTGRILGVKLPENFNLPFRSKNVSEYWRRTHITLITWLTQHIYYPITYQFRKHKYLSVIIAIFSTFILSGIWHGLSFGFLLWGFLNALYLVVEFLTKKQRLAWKRFNFIPIVTVFILVTIANYFFKLNDFQTIQKSLVRLVELPFLPINYMTDFVAVLGKGGYLEQQFHLLENVFLLVLFFALEPKLIRWSEKTNFKISYFTLIVILIFIFGNFASTNEFIYLQF